eukprot:1136311-Pelagomonas_calceolata.AAC.3
MATLLISFANRAQQYTSTFAASLSLSTSAFYLAAMRASFLWLLSLHITAPAHLGCNLGISAFSGRLFSGLPPGHENIAHLHCFPGT